MFGRETLSALPKSAAKIEGRSTEWRSSPVSSVADVFARIADHPASRCHEPPPSNRRQAREKPPDELAA